MKKSDEKSNEIECRCEKCTATMIRGIDTDEDQIIFCPSCGFYFRLGGWDGNYILIKDTMKTMTEKQYENR